MVISPCTRSRLSFCSVVRAIFVAMAGTTGCGGDAIVAPRPDPFLYVVLNQRTFVADPQRAFLLTVGSPATSDYRVAEQFEMRRVTDGAVFVWQDKGQRGLAPVRADGASLFDGNYALPDYASGTSLGARDIQAGDGFNLTVRTGGVTIRGSVTVPSPFALTLESQGSARVVKWPRVADAGGYSVEVGGITAPAFQTDTAFTLPPLRGSIREVRVKALDQNLSRYLSDTQVRRAGIDAGYGVFGAVTVATLSVPP